MKTSIGKSLMLRGDMFLFSRFHFLRIVAAATLFCSWQARAQESWSDSVPRIWTFAQNNCPLKVRGKSGDWANYRDSLPQGRNVIGAINPRRPDLVFFQLTRDSPFMFVAPRTCFEGEQNWQVLAEEEKRGGRVALRDTHTYFLGSLDVIADRLSLQPIEGATGERFPLRSRIVGSCVGGGYEKRRERWYYGGTGCLGLGKVQYKLVETKASDNKTSSYGDASMALYGSLRGTTYYDFQSIPYAMGFEIYAGFARASFASPSLINYEVAPSIWLTYGGAVAWRFYWKNVTITPKITLNKFLPRNIGTEIQIAYLFGGR
jgi:hypothetical protein